MSKREKQLESNINQLDNAIWETVNMLTNICGLDLESWEYESAIRCACGHLMFVSDSIKNDK